MLSTTMRRFRNGDGITPCGLAGEAAACLYRKGISRPRPLEPCQQLQTEIVGDQQDDIAYKPLGVQGP
jgi:hypothetical protein